jgi:molybdenum cofactor cytidylyltransferase
VSLYGGLVLEHFRRPLNRGALPGATAHGEATNPLCGDRIRISVIVDGGRIAGIGFVGDACAICTASASLLTSRVRGMTAVAASAIAPEEVISALETELPDGRVRCATLPLDALNHAVADRAAVSAVGAIVVAAGSATRFGSDKITAPLRGEPIIRHVVRALYGRAGHIVVVGGENLSGLREALDGMDARVIHNTQARRGMSQSIVMGVEACAECECVLIVLGDQPTLSVAAADAVIRRWRETGAEIVAPSFRGERGHPVLFARSVFDELRALAGDVGARAVVERDSARVAIVEIDADLPIDVDTVADLERLGNGERGMGDGD